MKTLIGVIALFLMTTNSFVAQMTSSHVEISTLYSENGEFFLRSVPWDNHSPSLRGTTSVYRNGQKEPEYVVPRGFDDADRNRLTLSNDGETIFYVISYFANETMDGLKSVNIYHRGNLIRSYTEREINGCDPDRERCSLLYSNYDEVVDREKSHSARRTIFRGNVSDQDRFLYETPLFASGDRVYLIDSKKIVHTFDLREGRHEKIGNFDEQFPQLKTIARKNNIEEERFESPELYDFPALASGEETAKALARSLGMKVYDIYSDKDEKYKKYSLKLGGLLNQDGTVEIESIDSSDLPKEAIEQFFRSNRFITTKIPVVFRKWYIEEYFFFRKADDRLAKKEREDELRLWQEESRKLLVAETIGGRYIPKNLQEAFLELDKQLSEIDKKEMAALKSRKDMIAYHHGLGTSLRNNWGLWGVSRLKKYFTDRGITHPDNMSSVVLFFYWDWLNGIKEPWKSWEQNPKRTIF